MFVWLNLVMKATPTALIRVKLVTACILLFAISGYAQLWPYVGKAGFSADASYLNVMATGPTNTPYIAYQDAANNYAVTAMKYNGTNWVGMGLAGFSPADVYSLSFVVNSADSVYVAFIDYTSSKVSVMEFNGTSWVYKGSPFFTDSAAMVSMSVGANDTLYAAYIDISDSSKITVMKYNGTGWVNVGLAGFSTPADEVSLAIDKNTNIPYVAYSDADSGDEVTTMMYNSGVWSTVGSPRFSSADAYSLSLAISNTGVPVIAYRDGGYSGKATVMQYTLGSWNNVGNPGFSKGTAYYTSLALDSTGMPFVAFQDAGNYNALSVMEYDGSNWVNIGSPACTKGTADYTSLAIDRHGRLYVGFEDGIQSYYASVVMYSHCNTGSPSLAISTNGMDTICPGAQPLLTAAGAATYMWSTGDSTSSSRPVLSNPNAVYTFYVTGTAANGCASSDSVKVYTRPAPPPVTVSGEDTLCKGDSTMLSATGALSYYWSNGATESSVTISPPSTTMYYVAGADAQGCADTVYTKVVVNNGPAITFTGQDTICKGDSTTLTAGGGWTYVWQPNGATTDAITVAPASTATYSITSTGLNGCTSEDSITVTVHICTGINEVNLSGQVNVSPNPAHNIAFLTSYVPLKHAQVLLYSISGQLIQQLYINNLSIGESYKLDVSKISTGMYYLKIITRETTAVYKIIKE